MSRKVRWGHLSELDRRFRVGSAGYRAYPRTALRHLHCWRTLHAQAGDHLPIRMSGTRRGIRPSSNMPLKMKEALVRKFRMRALVQR